MKARRFLAPAAVVAAVAATGVAVPLATEGGGSSPQTAKAPIARAAAAKTSLQRRVATPCRLSARTPALVNGQVVGTASFRCVKNMRNVKIIDTVQVNHNGQWITVGGFAKSWNHVRAGKTYSVQAEQVCHTGAWRTVARLEVNGRLVSTRTSAVADLTCA